MKWTQNLKNRFKGLNGSITRFPLTTAFLTVAAVLVAVIIHTDKDYSKLLWACAVGAVLSAALQAVYERFFEKLAARLLLMAAGVALTAGYYFMIRPAPQFGIEMTVRTAAVLFALAVAFLWAPVIRSRISFNESFLAAFKAFFHSALYAAVIMGGCSIILAAISELIFKLDPDTYSYVADVVFVLFAPLFFLSLIPVYPGRRERDGEARREQDEAIARAAQCPKFLEVLISYIVIPLTVVFTAILLVYIVLNVRGAFWSNNLLEPLLVSYAITVVLVYILASTLTNRSAVLFRRIFPKVLIPIVLFQIAASVLNLRDTGMTYSRYYAILFGIFAAAAGVVMSIVPVRKNGIIAAMLVAFSVVSVLPPVDAFTISRVNQKAILQDTLVSNGMLQDNAVTPNAALPDKAKKRIVNAVEYLNSVDELDEIPWLPADFSIYDDFYDTFGFHEYDVPKESSQSVNVFIESDAPLNIEGYDYLAHAYINTPADGQEPAICEIDHAGMRYTLTKEADGDRYDIALADGDGRQVIRFDTGEIFTRYQGYGMEKSEMSPQDATFSVENDQAKMTLVVQNASMNGESDPNNYSYVDFYVLLQLK